MEDKILEWKRYRDDLSPNVKDNLHKGTEVKECRECEMNEN